MYSYHGGEFKNAPFQRLLDKSHINIILALAHAPFIEALTRI